MKFGSFVKFGSFAIKMFGRGTKLQEPAMLEQRARLLDVQKEFKLQTSAVVHLHSQMEHSLREIHDRCEGLIESATEEAEDIVAQTKADSEASRQERAKWEQEKKRIASTHTFDPQVKLNVGGQLFVTSTATLTNCPNTMLGDMFSGRHALPKDETGSYFIDRDGRNFHEILNFLRAPDAYKTGQLDEKTRIELEREADFYRLKELMFPPSVVSIVPPVPTDPAIVITSGRFKTTVTRDDAGLWYMEGVPPVNYTRCLVTVCDTCGWGQPSLYPRSTYSNFGVQRFTAGRVITPAQPRQTEPCTWNGLHSNCD